jgi:arylsulfatase A-like enzyme
VNEAGVSDKPAYIALPYEGSIRVPMIVRLPGQIPSDTVSGALVSNVDLAP